MLFVLKTTYLIMGQHLLRLGKYSPDSPTFANLFCSDSINSSTFANLLCPDSIHSSTFANLLCPDSPDSPTFAKGLFWEKCDSPRHIRTSNLPFWRIWGEWPLLTLYLKLKKAKLWKNIRKCKICFKGLDYGINLPYNDLG